MRAGGRESGGSSRRELGAALLVLAGVTSAAGEERHPTLGLALDVPARYEAIPVQPDEPLIVLRYVWEPKHNAARNASPPKLYVLRIDWHADPEPAVEPPPITSFERYVAQHLVGWEIARIGPKRERSGWNLTEYELGPDGKAGAASARVTLSYWACELRKGDRQWIVLGACAKEEAEKQVNAWRRCAESLEFFEPEKAGGAEKWPRFYAKNPHFRNPELRMQLRSRLLEKWKAADTENFLIVYSTKNGNLVQHLEKRLEGIRRQYVELFPPVADITAVSTVRICEDREEYHLYGGPSGTAGYWNSEAEELVLFDFDNGQEGKEDSRIVLLHEAFHQYIHYAAGELDPHSWFNEGYGDYFSGADFTIQGGANIRVNPWRIERIQNALESGGHASWSEMIRMEKKDYYSAMRSTNYAMGWSMVYFLNKSRDAKRNPAWSKILPTYFETLKIANVRERTRLKSEGLAEKEDEVAKANAKVREEAVTAAFRGVDLFEIEKAWKAFTLELKPPK